MHETVREFIETYEGFDWENGEVVVVDQRTGKQGIYRRKNAESGGHVLEKQGENTVAQAGRDIWHWTHTQKTMLIVI